MARETGRRYYRMCSFDIAPGEMGGVVGGSGEEKVCCCNACSILLPENLHAFGKCSLMATGWTDIPIQASLRGKQGISRAAGVQALNPMLNIQKHLNKSMSSDQVLGWEREWYSYCSKTILGADRCGRLPWLPAGMAKRILACHALLSGGAFISSRMRITARLDTARWRPVA